ATGQLFAPVPSEWRPDLRALQTDFLFKPSGNTAWTAGYLPVNAALLALASRVGAQSLLGPLWAAITVIATCGVGPRLWPDRPDRALVATVLLSTSAHFLFTAMTTYAMSAHLALDMVWLWLFLRPGRLTALGAVAVGFLATGLHQVVFHPL